jgi:UDP-glucose 4-epimerase
VRALITGGAGFIGSTIAKELASNGAEVVVLGSLSSGYHININGQSGVRVVEKDVRDDAAVDAAVAGVDAVFHLAASVGNKRLIDQPVNDAEINVIGTLRVLEAARKAGVRKVVMSSSQGGEIVDAGQHAQGSSK